MAPAAHTRSLPIEALASSSADAASDLRRPQVPGCAATAGRTTTDPRRGNAGRFEWASSKEHVDDR